MKVLILGGDGMLGHQLLKSWENKFEVKVTLKDSTSPFSMFTGKNTYFGVNALDDNGLAKTISNFQPQVIVNALGVIKHRSDADDKIKSIQMNSLLPHRLTALGRDSNFRVITFSTDCVFSGSRGNYIESDLPDATDTYGQTKRMGEVTDQKNALTLRTSFWGSELKNFTNLIEWFLRSKGLIKGYSKAIYSGLSTFEMARLVENLMINHRDLHGLYHVSGEKINKYDLLMRLKTKLERTDIEIVEDNSVAIDRSLDSGKFRKATGYKPPTWEDMLTELAATVRGR